MRQKLIAAAAALTLGSFAAVGAFASQDAVDLRSATDFFSGGVLGAAVAPDPLVTETATATATETATPDATETSTPDATETGTPEATETAEPTDTPEASETPDDPEADDNEADGDQDDVHGIPGDNPSHHPEDGDGHCDKGETVINTPPSGEQVNVPCQASHDGDHGDQNNGHDGGAGQGSSSGGDHQDGHSNEGEHD